MNHSKTQFLKDDAHPDLLLSQQLAYGPCGLKVTNIRKEKESADYGALDFQLNGNRCKFRVGKVTPKKIGFFFTIWKRSERGPIIPYEEADPVDFFVFSVQTHEHFGQFFFPKQIFMEKGIVSCRGTEGKRAIRVYPPWVTTVSRQARSAQAWQQKHFLAIYRNGSVDKWAYSEFFANNGLTPNVDKEGL